MTASDDFTVRCWREDEARARELRQSNGHRDASTLKWGFAATAEEEDADDSLHPGGPLYGG